MPKYAATLQVRISVEQMQWMERLAETAGVTLAQVTRHLCSIRVYPEDDPSGFVDLIESLQRLADRELELAIEEHERDQSVVYRDFTVSQ